MLYEYGDVHVCMYSVPVFATDRLIARPNYSFTIKITTHAWHHLSEANEVIWVFSHSRAFWMGEREKKNTHKSETNTLEIERP